MFSNAKYPIRTAQTQAATGSSTNYTAVRWEGTNTTSGTPGASTAIWEFYLFEDGWGELRVGTSSFTDGVTGVYTAAGVGSAYTLAQGQSYVFNMSTTTVTVYTGYTRVNGTLTATTAYPTLNSIAFTGSWPPAGWTNLQNGSVDDNFVTVAHTATTVLGTSRTVMYPGSNSYITWGAGSSNYSALSTANPAQDKIMIGSADRSYQRVAYKTGTTYAPSGASPFTPTPTPTPSPTPTPTPTPTPSGASGTGWTYTYSTVNRNDFTGYVGGRVLLLNNGSYNYFNLTKIGIPYQSTNGASYNATVYVLNSSGTNLGSYTVTVASGAAFAISYVTVSHQFAAGATFYVIVATTNGGFSWNDYSGNPVASYNAVPPSSIVAVQNLTGCYSYSVPGVPTLFGSGYSYVGVMIQGYTS